MGDTKLLIIDDDPGIRETLAEVFRRRGYKASTAATGQEAMDKASKEVFHAALVDLRLPDMDGTELLGEFKKTHPDMVCCVITGHASCRNAIKALKDGASGYFQKPLVIEEVVHGVEKALEKKRLERDLKVSEERYRGLVETSPDAIISVNEKGEIIQWNLAASRVFGYSKEEAMGRPLDILIPERYRERYRQGFRRFQETGEVMVMDRPVEVEALGKDGSTIPVELTISVLKENGSYVFTGIIRDITQRKRAEEALKESESKFRDLAERSLVGVYLIQDGKFRYVNPKLAEIFGYTVEELTDRMGPEDLVPPEDWQVVKENIRKRISGEVKSIRYDFKGLRKDGEVIYVEAYGTRTVYQGRPAVIGTLLDITERKLAEEELRGAKQMLEKIAQGIGEGVLLLSEDFEILWANNTVLEETGKRLEDLLGRHCYQVTHHRDTPCQPPSDPCPIYEVQRTGKPITALHTHFDKDGEERAVVVSAYPIRDEDGKVVQYVHVTRDVTEEKRAEEALKRAYAELKTIDELKTNIISNVTHELRTPITISQAAIELAMDEESPQIRNELLGRAKKALLQQNRIVENLIQVAMVHKKGLTLDLEDINLADVAGLAAGEIRHEARQRGIDLELEVPDILVKADFKEVKRVILNLLDNGIKFNTKGGRVKVSGKVDGDMALLCVEDTGIGIPEEYHEKIFDRLFQVDSTATRKFSGTGMGLAVAKVIVEAHGGRIWVESTPGEGSTFCFTLPLSKEE
jgi:PAS domain S-box-containing protein